MASFLLRVFRARDLPSGAMSEGVDLIDIYADEEFNQVRGRREHWDFPASVEESLPASLRGFQIMPGPEDLIGLKMPLSGFKLSL